MEWAWLLFTALSDVDFEDGHLKFPVKPSTRPFTQVIPLAVEESVGEVSSKVGSKVATCNVLTLRWWSDTGCRFLRYCWASTTRLDPGNFAPEWNPYFWSPRGVV